MPQVIAVGNPRRYMRSLGIPDFEAASSAVGNKGQHVKSTFDPEDVSWWISSSTEYTALAGVDIPDSRWVAHARVRVSIWLKRQQTLCIQCLTSTNRVEGKHSNNLIPLCSLVGMPSELFRQTLRQILDTLTYLQR